MNLQGVNFIAVDFETAGPSQMACQVGFTIVKDGEIKETITRLIQPPGNQYDKNCISFSSFSILEGPASSPIMTKFVFFVIPESTSAPID